MNAERASKLICVPECRLIIVSARTLGARPRKRHEIGPLFLTRPVVCSSRSCRRICGDGQVCIKNRRTAVLLSNYGGGEVYSYAAGQSQARAWPQGTAVSWLTPTRRPKARGRRPLAGSSSPDFSRSW